MSEAAMSSNESSVVRSADGKVLNKEWFLPRHQGEKYHSVLRSIHETLRPKTYVEVGVRSGDSLVLAHCSSIGVDPQFSKPLNKALVDENGAPKPPFRLFEVTSDKFFAENDPRAILGVDHIDFFFLDGEHISDFLLRDVINAERLAAPNSIIALHDCLPIDIAMTLSRAECAASPYPVVYRHHWTGDCWRVVKVLQKYRPDIAMHVMDSGPTGLVLLTNLDPKSTVLSEKYDSIVAEMNATHLATIGLRPYMASLSVKPTAEFIGSANLMKRFTPWTMPQAA